VGVVVFDYSASPQGLMFFDDVSPVVFTTG
jgi:hypothetical protein